MPRARRRSPCPVACTLDLLGDRWTLLVIRDLFLGRQYFDEFLQSPEGIATNVLSERLARLMKDGLVSKRSDPNDKRRSTYHLTEKGQSLQGVLLPIANWGLRNIPKTEMMSGSEAALEPPK